jgi:dUTP pyrophosphatase
MRASCSRARASPRGTGSQSSTRPGELQVVLLNTDHERPFVADAGERIAQLVVLAVPDLALREVDELPASERGVRGFGSSREA